MSRMSTLFLLLLALVCMLGFTEAWLSPNSKAYKVGRAVKAPEYNSSLEGSTEEDALQAKSRLNTSGTVYTGPQACQLIQKVIRSSACHRRGGWRRSEFCDKRCSDIMKHGLEMVYHLSMSCNLTAM